MTLNIDDLGTVYEALFAVCAKAYNIGLKLGVAVGTLDRIIKQHSDPSDQLRETLKAWLKTAAQQKWQTIVNALRSCTIGEPKLASDIETEYCQDTPGQASGQAMPRDTQMEALQQQALQQQLESKSQPQQRLGKRLREQECAIEALQTQPLKRLPPMKRPAAQPQPELEQLPSMKWPPARPDPNPPQQETTLRKLIWRSGPKLPEEMSRGSSPTDGTSVYCNGVCSTSVHQYNSDTQQWRTLPDLPHIRSTLVMADSKLISVGGLVPGGATDSLLSLTGEGRDMKWSQIFSPMRTKRHSTAAICHGRSLIIAGGKDDGHNKLTTVEVLNMDTKRWSIASSLPHPFSGATTSICGERLYLLGGLDQTGPTRSVLTAAIPELLDSCQTLSQSTIWRPVTDAPYKLSSCATLCGHLVAVGGGDEADKATTAVSIYDDSTNSWQPMEAMKIPRRWALVASLHDNTMLAIGGFNEGRDLDTVEIAKLS